MTLGEFLTLQEALDKGLCGSSLTQFYYVARMILVKSETDFDKFDMAFEECFKAAQHETEVGAEMLRWLDKSDMLELAHEEARNHLNQADVILEMADDLCHDCRMNEYSHYEDLDWVRKYMHMRWKDEEPDVVSKTMFVMLKGDITNDHGVQAIVNAANTSLLGGGGVDGAIHRVAGPELLAECRLLSGCETGKAKLTKAYRLPCEYVIHTPGPRWNGGRSKKEHKLLASCYQSCLELAVKNGIRSIAFPSIATGVYCFPLEEAAKIAVDAAKQFVADHPGALDVIKWVLFDDQTLEVYQRELERWELD